MIQNAAESNIPVPPGVRQERLNSREQSGFPMIEWTVVHRPLGLGVGEDYFFQGENVSSTGKRYSVALVADAGPSMERVTASGEPIYRYQARVFCEKFAQELLNGKEIRRAKDKAEEGYFSDVYDFLDEGHPAQRRRTSIFDEDKVDSHLRAKFFFSAVRVTYPDRDDVGYNVETAIHGDCYVAVLIPHLEENMIIYTPKVYPMIKNGIAQEQDILSPGAIIFVGSDGSLEVLAQAIKELYIRHSRSSAAVIYQLQEEVTAIKDEFVWTRGGVEQDRERIQKLLGHLRSLMMDWEREEKGVDAIAVGNSLIKEIREIAEKAKAHDDVTLLMTCLPAPERDKS